MREVRRRDRSEQRLAAAFFERELLDRGLGPNGHGLFGDRGHATSSSVIPRSTLSMSRALPTRAASEMTARSEGRSSSSSVSGSATDTYSSAIRGTAVSRLTRSHSLTGSRALRDKSPLAPRYA